MDGRVFFEDLPRLRIHTIRVSLAEIAIEGTGWIPVVDLALPAHYRVR